MCHEHDDIEDIESDESDEWNGLQCQICGSIENVSDAGGGEEICFDCFSDMLS